MRRVVALLSVALALNGGCALVAASVVSHNSRGSACVESPVPSLVDILIASGTGVLLVYKGTVDESPGWLTVPILFGISGLIGVASVYACTHPDTPPPAPAKPRGRFDEDQPPDNVIPHEPYEDPNKPRDATPEERGPLPDPEKQACSINDRDCPEGMTCVLLNGFDGFCKFDRH